VPLHIADGRLLGGLDLSATLRAGRPVAERGLLAEADGGVVLLAMAERVARSTAAHLSAALDNHEVLVERDGITARTPTRFGVVALDEGANDEEQLPHTLVDRFAMLLDLNDIAWRDALPADYSAEEVLAIAARERLADIRIGEPMLEAICGTALALGVDSLRASLAAARVACAAAALAGARRGAGGRRQRRRPAGAGAARDPPADARTARRPAAGGAAAAGREPGRQPRQPDPRAGDRQAAGRRGAGVRRGRDPGQPAGDAARWARCAAAAAPAASPAPARAARCAVGPPAPAAASPAPAPGSASSRPCAPRRPGNGCVARSVSSAGKGGDLLVEVRHDDFRVTRYKQRSETTTIFVVDASGSAALHRLAEAKGAVELLLADCYVRRDRVAMIAFRGPGAELLLPPTRSLVRAKRGLAGLPGGGGTPLACGIDAAVDLADGVQRRGGTPVVVMLTDGRANVTRDGIGGRAQGHRGRDLLRPRLPRRRTQGPGGRHVAAPAPDAEKLAQEMGAVYLPLPHANAAALSGAVQAVS
jgi:magnesium chelatase subunit D